MNTAPGGSEQRSARQAVLVGLAQFGDLQALDALLQATQENIYAHIVTIVGDADTARDVLQESLLLIARTIRSLRDPALFNAWAYRIATREAVRRAKRETRQQRRYPPLTEETMTVAASPEADDRQPELLNAAWSLVTTLPPASQLVVRMRYAADMSYDEIAGALEIPLGTVKSRLAYGIAMLRKGMETKERGRP